MKKRNVVLVWFFILIIFGLHAIFLNHVVDDAFISFRYAENLNLGYGLVFNPGEKVEGITNFLWTVLLSLFMRKNFSPVFVSKFLGIIAGIANLFATYKIYLISTKRKKTELGYLLPVALLATNGCFALWAIAGLETSLFTFFILLGIYFYLKSLENYKYLWSSSFFFGLSVLTRPEGLGFWFLTTIYFFWTNLPQKKILKIKLIPWLCPFLFIFVIFTIWRVTYYGSFFCNTFYLRFSGQTGGIYLEGFRYIGNFCLTYLGILLFLPALLFSPIKKPFLNYFRLIIVSYLVYILRTGGDYQFFFRFFYPILPLLFILFSDFLLRIREIISERRNSVTVGTCNRMFGFLIAALILQNSLPSFLGEEKKELEQDRRLKIIRVETGKWLRNNTSAKDKIAVGGAGIIPFYSKLYTIDCMGVNDPNIARLKAKSSDPAHGKFDLNYVLTKNPAIFVEEWLLRSMGAFHSKTFKALYIPYRVRTDKIKFTVYKRISKGDKYK